MFYEITNRNGQKNHLFGAINLEGISLPDEVIKAMENAETCFFETDLSAIKLHNLRFLHSSWIMKYSDVESHKLRKVC